MAEGDLAPAPSLVHGSATLTYVTDTGRVTRPRNFADASIEALLPTPSGFSSLPGVGAADGTFTIANVPDGDYYLRINQAYFWMHERSIDLSRANLGRPDAVTPTSDLTVSLDNVTNLQAWADGDTLEFFSAGANIYFDGLQDKLTPALTASATALTGGVSF